MADIKEQYEIYLDALTEEHEAKAVEMRKKVAMTIINALQLSEELDELWELVEDMAELDEGLVSKLEFVISSSFIERNLDKIEGGRYAN